MATITSFTELEIWKLAVELHKEVFELTKVGALSKDFSLKDQMNRSSGAIMDNIAEGFGRGGRLEFVQFLTRSRGSASGLQSQLYRCLKRNYVSEEIFNRLNSWLIKQAKRLVRS